MARILLIDDDMDLVAMNKIVLTKRGHSVDMAYSAAEARKKLAASKPEVIVLDVMMESLDAGFEIARDIHDLYPDVPTIMLTSVHEAAGLPFRFEPDEAWLPVTVFLDKPVEPAKLADRIEGMLKK
jgi:CheY-like chemotaxis protein